MPYEDDYKMWLEKMLIESNPDWVCDAMCDVELTHEWCGEHCGEGSDYVTPKCLHMYYHHIARADRKTEPSGYKMEQVDEPQTDTEIAKAIVHKMIDDAVIAEDAYPDLRQKMHDAVDEYEPQRGCDADCNEDCTECAKETELWKAEQTEPQTEDKCKGCIYENGDSLMACVSCQGKVPYAGYEWDEPQTITIEGKMPLNEWRKICPENPQFKDEPQTEYRRVGQAIDSVTGKVLGETYDVPQTDCPWKNDEHIPTDLASTMLKNRFKEQK